MTRQLPIRVSTLVLGVIFAVTLAVYLLVRPQPAVPAQTVHIVLSPTTTSARPSPTQSRTVQTALPPTTPAPTTSSPTSSPAPTSSASTSGSTATPGASSASPIPPSPTPG